MAETHPVHTRLIRCPDCGMWTGIVDLRKARRGLLPLPRDPLVHVLCLCDGPLCRRCGTNRIFRPVSDYYDEQSNTVRHVPYFGALAACRECRKVVGGQPQFGRRGRTSR